MINIYPEKMNSMKISRRKSNRNTDKDNPTMLMDINIESTVGAMSFKLESYVALAIIRRLCYKGYLTF
jgi:hypothetical protein